MMNKKQPDLSALDSLMGKEVEETPAAESAEASPEAPKPAKQDPATVIASIKSQLDELSSMLPMG